MTVRERLMAQESLLCNDDTTLILKAADRRKNVRYPGGKAAASCLVTDEHGDLWPAEVRDISAGGLSFVLFRPVRGGAILSVELSNKLLRFSRRVQLKVLHTRSHPGGGYIIGGVFAKKLSASELQALV